MLIDWTCLNTLRSDIGEEDFADIAFLFVTEISEHLEGLKGAPQAARAADFHFLRGSAANLGFTGMAEACNRAETACKSGQVPDIAAVEASFAASIAAVAPKVPALVRAA